MYLVVVEDNEGMFGSEPVCFESRKEAEEYAAARPDFLHSGYAWVLYDCRHVAVLLEQA